MITYLNTISTPGSKIWMHYINDYATLVATKFYWGPVKLVKESGEYFLLTFDDLLTD